MLYLKIEGNQVKKLRFPVNFQISRPEHEDFETLGVNDSKITLLSEYQLT